MSIEKANGCAPNATWLLICCISLASTSLLGMPNTAFKATGYVIQEQFAPNDASVRQTDRIDFTVAVSNGTYRIHTLKLTNLTPGEIPEIVTGSDGTDSYSINIAARSTNVVWVSAGTYPGGLLAHEAVLWLAYCSSQYLDRDPAAPPVQLGCLLNDYKPSEVHFTIQRFADELRLPSSVEISSPAYAIGGGEGADKVPLPVPYEQGYRVGNFAVVRHETVGGLEIPAEFVFQNYIPRQSNAAGVDDLLLKWRIRFIATKVSADVDPNDLIPTLAKPCKAFDFRFVEQTQGRSLSYAVTNSPIRSMNDPVVLKALRQKLTEIGARADNANSLQRRKKYIWLLFAVMAGLPILVWLSKQPKH
jgi:hypothetical protein